MSSNQQNACHVFYAANASIVLIVIVIMIRLVYRKPRASPSIHRHYSPPSPDSSSIQRRRLQARQPRMRDHLVDPRALVDIPHQHAPNQIDALVADDIGNP